MPRIEGNFCVSMSTVNFLVLNIPRFSLQVARTFWRFFMELATWQIHFCLKRDSKCILSIYKFWENFQLKYLGIYLSFIFLFLKFMHEMKIQYQIEMNKISFFKVWFLNWKMLVGCFAKLNGELHRLPGKSVWSSNEWMNILINSLYCAEF